MHWNITFVSDHVLQRGHGVGPQMNICYVITRRLQCDHRQLLYQWSLSVDWRGGGHKNTIHFLVFGPCIFFLCDQSQKLWNQEGMEIGTLCDCFSVILGTGLTGIFTPHSPLRANVSLLTLQPPKEIKRMNHWICYIYLYIHGQWTSTGHSQTQMKELKG